MSDESEDLMGKKPFERRSVTSEPAAAHEHRAGEARVHEPQHFLPCPGPALTRRHEHQDAVREADIIALQEVTRNNPQNGGRDMVAELRELLPEHFSIFGAPYAVDMGSAT